MSVFEAIGCCFNRKMSAFLFVNWFLSSSESTNDKNTLRGSWEICTLHRSGIFLDFRLRDKSRNCRKVNRCCFEEKAKHTSKDPRNSSCKTKRHSKLSRAKWNFRCTLGKKATTCAIHVCTFVSTNETETYSGRNLRIHDRIGTSKAKNCERNGDRGRQRRSSERSERMGDQKEQRKKNSAAVQPLMYLPNGSADTIVCFEQNVSTNLPLYILLINSRSFLSESVNKTWRENDLLASSNCLYPEAMKWTRISCVTRLTKRNFRLSISENCLSFAYTRQIDRWTDFLCIRDN